MEESVLGRRVEGAERPVCSGDPSNVNILIIRICFVYLPLSYLIDQPASLIAPSSSVTHQRKMILPQANSSACYVNAFLVCFVHSPLEWPCRCAVVPKE